METSTFEKMRHHIMNVVANMEDLKDYVAWHEEFSLSIETLPYCQGMCLV